MVNFKSLEEQDPEVYDSIQKETHRQNAGLEMIPAENFTSKAVMEAMGSTFTNKYAEGYPGKRYYGGNEFTDEVETLAIDRCKKLFGAEHVNVQSDSGSPANMAAYLAIMNPGDTLMGLRLDQGGHLTHGFKVSATARVFKSVQYTVDPETHLLDYDAILKLAKEVKPKVIVSGFSAYPREFDFKAFHEIAEEVGAYSMADIAHIAGLVAAGVHPSPFPHMDIVTSTTHKTLRGPRSGLIMCKTEDRLKEKYRPEAKKNLAQQIDFSVFPGLQGGPHEHIIAAKAVCFKEADTKEFKQYAEQIVKNSRALADALLDFGFNLITGGTDNHLILADITTKGLTGKQAETALDLAGITLNKNAIPYDTRSPFDPSGIRFGTPAITTRGMKESEMKQVAEFMNRAVENWEDKTVLEKVKSDILELCKEFPLYEWVKI